MQLRYTPRRFNSSPLFQLVYHHFDHFQSDYQRIYSEHYGTYREIITHTVNRYLLCGDPREGIARFECSRCHHSISVPFSCKTRLFCPTCHEAKILLWIDAIREKLLLHVPHRFWTFSVPKRLRPYFMRNRKLLSVLVSAANNSICKAVGGGECRRGVRPGIISLIQTHSDTLDWNSHLHLIVTNGTIDYRNIDNPTFRPCFIWDTQIMTELFRFELISSLVKMNVLTADIANNMLSWPHSGFHVHCTDSFMPDEGDLLEKRLAYAFRPAVSLNRLTFDGKQVIYRTRKTTLKLSPNNFLVKLTLHIPDRYQNIRRYAGFYSSNIQREVRKFKGVRDCSHQQIETKSPVKPTWATLIAKIFGAIPVICSHCQTPMDLKEFLFDDKLIQRMFPYVARAPPKRQFEKVELDENEWTYSLFSDDQLEELNQDREWVEEDFNQENNW